MHSPLEGIASAFDVGKADVDAYGIDAGLFGAAGARRRRRHGVGRTCGQWQGQRGNEEGERGKEGVLP
ncbi:MAG: hypothetical protein IPM54_44280 [Polyangiaceae bacterium]|nr:hypothetical protein [Polyangiaceae bacterium]